MTRHEAEGLARFINRCSERYEASALPLGFLGDTAWVILSDRNTGGNPPPIMEPGEYVERARVAGPLSPDCLELLERWSADWNDDDPADLDPLHSMERPAALRGSETD